jgi:predicted RNA-binding protein with PUA-like domain
MAWLVKTEPDAYSFDDLVRDKRTVWDGVTNPQALKNLRTMAAGERVFVYHTGGERRVVGRAEVVRGAEAGAGHGALVELRAVSPLKTPVPLADLKNDGAFTESPLLRQGRLSVVPLTAEQVRAIERHGEE